MSTQGASEPEVLYPSLAGFHIDDNANAIDSNPKSTVLNIQDSKVPNPTDDEPLYTAVNRTSRAVEIQEFAGEDTASLDADKKSLSCSIDDAIYDNPENFEDSNSYSSIPSLDDQPNDDLDPPTKVGNDHHHDIDSGKGYVNGCVVRNGSLTTDVTREMQMKRCFVDYGIYSSIEEVSDSVGNMTVNRSEAVKEHVNISPDSPSYVPEPLKKNLGIDLAAQVFVSPVNEIQKFRVRYLGSMPISEESMKGAKSSQAVRKCIVYLSVESPGDIGALHEWSTESKMLLSLEADNLTLLNAQDGTALISHKLSQIRVWGTGKEANSPIFAYVTRSKTSESFVCRVLSCEDCKAQRVASAIRAICEVKARTKQAPNPTKAISTPQATSTTAVRATTGAMSTIDTPSSSTSSKESVVSIQCKYVGSFDVAESDGKQDVDTIVSTLCSTKKCDEWSKVVIDISPSTICVKGSENPSIIHVQCQTSSLIYCGIYVKSNKFGSFNVQTRPNEYKCHVFYCEPTAHLWFMNIQAICKTSMDLSSDKRGQPSKRSFLKNVQRIFVQNKT